MRLLLSLTTLSLLFAHHAVAQTQTPATTQPQRARTQQGAVTPNPNKAQIAAGVGEVPRSPFPALNPQQQQHLEQLLDYWQHRSAKVKTYSCDFVRFEYDPVFGPRDPRIAKTRAEGIIRYSSPDKGEFNVLRIGQYKAPTQAEQQPAFDMQPVKHEEHWICDGASVFELNPQKKQLIERKLPPEMQGTQIADGPLPFMFGATKKKLLARYWMRELVPPKNRPGEYWIEAYPRTRADAADFQMVRVILDQKTFLPNALQVFPPSYDPKVNPSRTAYVFSKRKINDPIHRGQEFLGRFISPKPPLGWKKVVENYGPAAAPLGPDRPQMANRRPDDQARRPAPQNGNNR